MIIQHKQRPLNIYRASAGSGKTHLLTGFYIKMLFLHELMPDTHPEEMKFSEILAVTFTNKATAEMKGRIIQELFILSDTPQHSHYLEDVLPQGAEPDDSAVLEAIKDKARLLLVQILNDYSQFNISTIDSFFQKIVRSFARELNVPGNYEVELDADRVLEAAVSAFLEKLDNKANPEIFKWMESFSRKRITEGSGWDFRSSLLELARNVLASETYRQHCDAIRQFTSHHTALRQYADMLADTQRKWKKKLRELGEEGLNLMNQAGWEATEFKYKGVSSVLLFGKWAEGEETQASIRFIAAADDPDTLYDKKRKTPTDAFRAGMQALMRRCVDHTTGQAWRHYCTATVIRKNFYELGILALIDQEVTNYCNEQNQMLLSSTTELLSRLIGQDDAPFIYEKTGTHIHSFMIDEFQDTSGMQWGNFKPLVSNSLSQQYQNLIVGDVKQSIYRWRGGDWNLLNSELRRYEPPLHYDDTTSLTYNWRSLPAIIDFNNDFFSRLARQLDLLLGQDSTCIQDIYADVAQKIPGERKEDGGPQGLLHIGFLTPRDEAGAPMAKPRKKDFMDEAARRLPEAVIQLQRNGFKPHEIAILCRYNRECRWAAEAMLRYKHEHPQCTAVLDIISDEALQLSARPVVQVLIGLMRHLQAPDSAILCTIARTSLLQLQGHTAQEALSIYFSLPQDRRPFMPGLAHRPLYEMAEHLIAHLPAQVIRDDAPYLQAFRDAVLEFSCMQSADLTSFLEWWDQTGCHRSIATPQGQDAIQILSVHKSKGLGMPAIVMPFASWELDIDTSHNQVIWCQPQQPPFSLRLPLPIPLGKDLGQTIFEQDYRDERQRALIDNINTVYVAFTRAREAMVLLTPKPERESTMLEFWLQDYIAYRGCLSDEYTIGSWQRRKRDKQNEKGETGEAKTPYKDHVEPLRCPAEEITINELPQITILHDPARPDVTAKQRGNYIHAVLQQIRVADQADEVIHRLYMRGEIDPQLISQHQMTQAIHRLLAMPEVKPWFAAGLQVLNETTLMDSHGDQRRPDRIIIDAMGRATVIDYKTGDPHQGYHRQVTRYMNILRQLGFTSVRGFLLYLKNSKVVEVNLGGGQQKA